jgi:hypothetical protein
VLARWTAPEIPVHAQFELAPAPVQTLLPVRTLRVAARLPRLRRPAASEPPAALAVAPPAPPSASALPWPALRDFGRHARAAWPRLARG